MQFYGLSSLMMTDFCLLSSTNCLLRPGTILILKIIIAKTKIRKLFTVKSILQLTYKTFRISETKSHMALAET